jgi:hypothetical protein
MVNVSEFRRPPATRRLTERERTVFLRKHDPDRLRLPLLHDVRRGEHVVLSRGQLSATAKLLDANDRLVVAYSWALGSLAERVTASFAVRRG